jgi:hypothetical protein
MSTLEADASRPRLPLPADLADVGDLLEAFAARERSDAVDEHVVAEALHTAIGHRPDVDDPAAFDAVATTRQHAYLSAAAVAVRLMSPAWVAMATQIAAEEPDAQGAVRMFLYVLQGLAPLTTGQRIELMRAVLADAPWHSVDPGDGDDFYICPRCWPMAQSGWTEAAALRGVTVLRVAPDTRPCGVQCQWCMDHTTANKGGER